MLEIPKGFVKIEYCQWLENIHLPNWIIDFCKYILVTESSVFKLWDIFTNANKIKNKAMNKIKNILESLKKHYELQNSEYFLENTKNLFSVLNIDRDDIFLIS